MGDISRVHSGKAVFRFFFAEQLQSCNVLKEYKSCLFALIVNFLNFYGVVKLFVHAHARDGVSILDSFFYNADKTGDFVVL